MTDMRVWMYACVFVYLFQPGLRAYGCVGRGAGVTSKSDFFYSGKTWQIGKHKTSRD